jgi:hypothetical protein
VKRKEGRKKRKRKFIYECLYVEKVEKRNTISKEEKKVTRNTKAEKLKSESASREKKKKRKIGR